MKDRATSVTLLDKAISYMAPVHGARRMKARLTMAFAENWVGSSRTKRSLFGFTPRSASQDKLLRNERQTMVDRSHSLMRNHPIVSGVIESNCINIVGSGLQLHSRIDREVLGINDEKAEELESLIEREFELFSETTECDVSRINDFYDLQNITMRQYFVPGESFTVLPFLERRNSLSPYGLKIQIVEPERICNKDKKNDYENDSIICFDGIEKDKKTGEPLKYNICSAHPGDISRTKLMWETVEARDNNGLPNILHHYTMVRPGQTRGVPYLAPIIEPLVGMDKFSKAVLENAVIQALFTVVIESESDPELNDSNENGPEGNDNDIKLGSGSIIGLRPGESAKGLNPTQPSPNFDPYFNSMLNQVSIGLNIPFENVTKRYLSSYTAAQAAFNDAWRFYKTRRIVVCARKFCQPIFEKFLWEAIARGRIPAPGFFDDPIIRKAYCGSEWIGPARGHINPTVEATAAKTRMEIFLTTLEQEMAEYNGGRLDRNMKQIIKEIRAKQAAGLFEQSNNNSVNNPEYSALLDRITALEEEINK